MKTVAMAHVVMVVEATIAEVIARVLVKEPVRVNVVDVLVAKVLALEHVNSDVPVKNNSNS
ncbi:MAG: hypothetical protein J6P83_06430 [Bacteroidales bacterium]|nr:hypothetical protein [Bacteroidales bacterium]